VSPGPLEPGVVARYDADGTHDYTFGSYGVVNLPDAQALDLTADGKLVTAGNPPAAGAGVAGPRDPSRVRVRRRLTATAAADRVAASGDTIYVEGTAGKDTVTLATVNGSLGVTLNGTTRTFTAQNGEYFVVVGGNAGDDTIDATAAAGAAVYAFGGAGNDVVRTAGGADLLSGGYGNDTLSGGGGDDVAYGGRGNDVVNGGDGDDRLFGDGEYDGRADPDPTYGGRLTPQDVGADRVYGGAGNDSLTGSGTFDRAPDLIADYLDGGTGFDVSPTDGPADANFAIEAFG
jgi:Ca2+-binding RTX toxin-like protein